MTIDGRAYLCEPGGDTLSEAWDCYEGDRVRPAIAPHPDMYCEDGYDWCSAVDYPDRVEGTADDPELTEMTIDGRTYICEEGLGYGQWECHGGSTIGTLPDMYCEDGYDYCSDVDYPSRIEDTAADPDVIEVFIDGQTYNCKESWSPGQLECFAPWSGMYGTPDYYCSTWGNECSTEPM